jgi:hypothetical protein
LRDDSGGGEDEDEGVFEADWESMAGAFGGRGDVRLFYAKG